MRLESSLGERKSSIAYNGYEPMINKSNIQNYDFRQWSNNGIYVTPIIERDSTDFFFVCFDFWLDGGMYVQRFLHAFWILQFGLLEIHAWSLARDKCILLKHKIYLWISSRKAIQIAWNRGQKTEKNKIEPVTEPFIYSRIW